MIFEPTQNLAQAPVDNPEVLKAATFSKMMVAKLTLGSKIDSPNIEKNISSNDMMTIE